MTAHWPQLLVLAWSVFVFSEHCRKSGQAVERKYDPTARLFGLAITLSILWAGGFFAPIGWGQP